MNAATWTKLQTGTLAGSTFSGYSGLTGTLGRRGRPAYRNPAAATSRSRSPWSIAVHRVARIAPSRASSVCTHSSGGVLRGDQLPDLERALAA